MYMRYFFWGMMLWCTTAALAMAQPKVGRIDVAAVMESLPEADALRYDFMQYKYDVQNVLRMQIEGMYVAIRPEFTSVGESAGMVPKDFVTAFAEIHDERQKRIGEMRSMLIQREHALLQPLMEKVDAAIVAVQQELRLDTVLRTNACPFGLGSELTSWNRLDTFYWPGEGSRNDVAIPHREPCPRFGTVLFVNESVIDIATQVLGKLLAQSGN